MAPSHIKTVKVYIKNYYLPFFGSYNAKEIRTFHVEDFLSQLPKHLAIKSKKNIMTMFKNFCNWMYKREVILRKPQFPALYPPEPVIEWISKEDQLKILVFIPDYHKPIFLFMFYHPVRPGEARALKVKDFDIENRNVCISKSFSLNEIRSRKNRKPYFLPLSETFNPDMLKDKLPDSFVFTNQNGNPYSDRRLNQIWHRARKKAGIPHIKLYNATRHSIASQAVNEGISLDLVSKALGHSTVEMTKKYASLNTRMLRAIIDGTKMVQIKDFKNDKSLKNKGKN